MSIFSDRKGLIISGLRNDYVCSIIHAVIGLVRYLLLKCSGGQIFFLFKSQLFLNIISDWSTKPFWWHFCTTEYIHTKCNLSQLPLAFWYPDYETLSWVECCHFPDHTVKNVLKRKTHWWCWYYRTDRLPGLLTHSGFCSVKMLVNRTILTLEAAQYHKELKSQLLYF